MAESTNQTTLQRQDLAILESLRLLLTVIGELAPEYNDVLGNKTASCCHHDTKTPAANEKAAEETVASNRTSDRNPEPEPEATNTNDEEEHEEREEEKTIFTIPSILAHLDTLNLRLAKQNCLNADSYHSQFLTHSIDALLAMASNTVSRDTSYGFSPQSFYTELDYLAGHLMMQGQVLMMKEFLGLYGDVLEGATGKGKEKRGDGEEKGYEFVVPEKMDDVRILEGLISSEDDFEANLKKLSEEATKKFISATNELHDVANLSITMPSRDFGRVMRQQVALWLRLNDVRAKMGLWIMCQMYERKIELGGKEEVLENIKTSLAMEGGEGGPRCVKRSEDDAEYWIHQKWVYPLYKKARKLRVSKFHIGDIVTISKI